MRDRRMQPPLIVSNAVQAIDATNADGMTIDGVAVSDLMAAYRAAR